MVVRGTETMARKVIGGAKKGGSAVKEDGDVGRGTKNEMVVETGGSDRTEKKTSRTVAADSPRTIAHRQNT